jgi:hypothetical protein
MPQTWWVRRMAKREKQPELSDLAIQILKRVSDGPLSTLEIMVEFGKEPEFGDAINELINYGFIEQANVVLN